MKRAVTTCAAVCMVLSSAGQSMANVSMPFTESWPELEADENQSCILDISFGLAAPVGDDVFWRPGKQTFSLRTDERSMALFGSTETFRPTISARPYAYLAHGRAGPADMLAGLYFSNPQYAQLDLNDLGETSAHDGLAFGAALPSGVILLGCLGVGLIGWSWRCRNLSYKEYP